MAILKIKTKVDEVVAGTKRMTIEPARRRPIRKLDRLMLYDVRQAESEAIKSTVCTKTMRIQMTKLGGKFGGVILDRYLLNEVGREKFAKMNGFDTYEELAKSIAQQYGLPFNGVVIEWKI